MKNLHSVLIVVLAALLPAVIFAALPAGYEEVESVTANGAQYLDTGVAWREGLKAEVHFQYTRNVSRCVLGAGAAKLSKPAYAAINRDYALEETLEGDAGANTFYLFALNNAGTAADLAFARVFSAKLSVGDSVLCDLRPCRETASGEYGFYDLVAGAFRRSLGTKPFFRQLRVGIYSGYGGYGAVSQWHKLIDLSPELERVNISAAMAQEGSVFNGLDTIVMPGGSSYNEYATLDEAGRANLIGYIRNGGKYFGTCAGAHLVLDDELNISGYKYSYSKNAQFMNDIVLNDEGMRELGLDQAVWNMRYSHGPFITNGLAVAGADIHAWGSYTNTAGAASTNGHQMEGKYAVLGGSYYDGKMLFTSSHPESTLANFPFIRQGLRWLTGRDDITVETAGLDSMPSSRTNIVFVKKLADGIYPLADTMMKVYNDPRMNLRTDTFPESIVPTARALFCDTAENGASYHRGDYKPRMDAMKRAGGLVLIMEDGLSSDDTWRYIDGLASDRRAEIACPWDGDNRQSFTGDRTFTGLDLRISDSGEYTTAFADGEIAFVQDANSLGGDWAYCGTTVVHRVAITNALVSAVYGNDRRSSWNTVSSGGSYTQTAKNRFEIGLGPRNGTDGAAVVSFSKRFTIGKGSSLALDARGKEPGNYPIFSAEKITLQESTFLSAAQVQVDDGRFYVFRRTDDTITLSILGTKAIYGVDWVASTAGGGQYLDTGINLQDRIRLDIDFMWTSREGDASTYAGMFGAVYAGPGAGVTNKLYLAYANSTLQWRSSLGTSAMTTLPGAPDINTRYHLDVTVDGTTITQSENGGAPAATEFANTAALPTCPHPLYLFGINGLNGATSRWPARLYGCRVYTNLTVLARDYRPCYSVLNRTYGLYDLVTKTFLPSATGEFTGASLPADPLPVDPNPPVPDPNAGKDGFRAEGGMVTRDGDYTIHTFTNSSEIVFHGTGTVDVLLVGGGGGGGAGRGAGGGGGAGGFVYRTGLPISAGTYLVTVGAGGAGGTGTSATAGTRGTDGGNTIAFDLIAHGGGGGGNDGAGRLGGSGGGAACGYHATAHTHPSGGVAWDGEGYPGGAAANGLNEDDGGGHVHCWNGGGGGAGAPGENGVMTEEDASDGNVTGEAGAGGDGLPCSITGTEVWYAGGGGGGFASYYTGDLRNKGIAGGRGGGGNGSGGSSGGQYAGGKGTDGLGGGGGGGGAFSGKGVKNGGKGGCGVVIIRYREVYPEHFESIEITEGEADCRKVVIEGEKYSIYTFTTNATVKLTGSSYADVLLVGGGGGGGAGRGVGGGGGAGGFVYRTRATITNGTYEIVVGMGGAGGTGTSTTEGSRGLDGGNTAAFGLTAHGGGGGGGGNNANSGPGRQGGSGSGAACGYNSAVRIRHAGGTGTDGEGYHGGSATNGLKSGTSSGHLHCWNGGGGGAGAPGGDGVCTAEGSTDSAVTGAAGRGGDGLPCSITGAEVWYAGGGGGGFASYSTSNRNQGIAGGKGGGGKGSGGSSGDQYAGGNGTDGLGGGGGGGGAFSGKGVKNGGKGGSGIVILRVRLQSVKRGTLLIFR